MENSTNHNILYSSQDNTQVDTKQKNSLHIWHSKFIKYNVLTQDQINTLEREIIKRQLVVNKHNIKKLAKEYKIPLQKCIDYFINRMRTLDRNIQDTTKRLIDELYVINELIQSKWEEYNQSVN